ncbi:hypothetical protein CN514_06155 [Bacillus sp. AFS001701]|uniref:AAA family ATPase n=1 Tax=Bacillus sp. AFS001701 TaxID=2033480 RepID=UPI000BF78F12|nr:AAA family ATPase [Bacillus sp. AFS001701]PET71741.1 hypothetical protein CN514_06155 [Bacillus sp. AFS001701]
MNIEDTMLIKINVSYRENMTADELKNVTSISWVISQSKLEEGNIKYYCAVYRNIIKEVYELVGFEPDKNVGKDKRFILHGRLAKDEIRLRLIDMNVQSIHKGSGNPIKYTSLNSLLSLPIEGEIEEYFEVNKNEMQIPSIDFSSEVKMDDLYFENKELIIKQVKIALKKGKNIILTGPPGTGKSKMAKEICRSFGVDYKMTTATSDWSAYETIGGNRPNLDGTLSFKPGLFLNCFKEEKTLIQKNDWLIIDEMNRADIDKAFGALFSALTGDQITLNFQGDSGNQITVRPEKDMDKVSLNDYEFIIPKDWRLIGTMNTIDKSSLYEMSYAFMRRFAFIPVGVPKLINSELIDYYLPLWGIFDYSYSETLAKIWRYINQYRQIGPAIIEDISKFTEEDGDFTSAVILYVLPQFEGLLDTEIIEFINKLEKIEVIDSNRLLEFATDFFNIKE